MIWLSMFWEFFKAGLFSAGGGLATLPFLYEISQSTGWFTTEDIANMIAISESTPGPLGVNMSTYAGYQALGILGGIWATLSLTFPALFIITAISKVLQTFKNALIIQKIFYGLHPCSAALITAAGLGVAKISLMDIQSFERTQNIGLLFQWPSILLAIFIWILLKKLNRHPIFYIIFAAVSGIIFEL